MTIAQMTATMAKASAVLSAWSRSQASAREIMRTAIQPARPAAPSIAAPLPAVFSSSRASVFASSTSWRKSVDRSEVISENSSPSEASGRFGSVAGSYPGVDVLTAPD